MKRYQWMAASLLLAGSLFARSGAAAPQARAAPPDKPGAPPPAVMATLEDALAHGRSAGWKGMDDFLAVTRYVQVTLGAQEYVFTREGRFVGRHAAHHPSEGVVGRLAETGWDYLDIKRKVFSDTYGHLILENRHGKWQRVASDGGDGYRPAANLKKAGVPAAFIKRLKLGEPADQV